MAAGNTNKTIFYDACHCPTFLKCTVGRFRPITFSPLPLTIAESNGAVPNQGYSKKDLFGYHIR